MNQVKGRDRPDREGYEHEDAGQEDRVELFERFGYILSRKRGEGVDRACGEGEAGEGEQKRGERARPFPRCAQGTHCHDAK